MRTGYRYGEDMNARELVQQVDTLVSLPEVCVKINQMIESSNVSAKDIGEVIAEDADLSARLLKIVNSAFYGLPGPVDTISRAVTVVGTQDLRNLALMTSACQVFQGIPGELVNMAEFWRIGVSTGVIARTLARHCGVLHGERLFVQGVLHDIGRLVIFRQLPELSRDILLVANGQDDVQTLAEQDILGFTHGEVGFELLARWQLPESVLTSVRYHHEPEQTADYRIETSLIHIASTLANGMNQGECLEDTLAQIDDVVWKTTGLTEEGVASVLEDVSGEVREVIELMFSPASRDGSAKH